MKLHARTGGRTWVFDIERAGDRLIVTSEGRTWEVVLDGGTGAFRTLCAGDRRIEFGWTRTDGTYAIVIDGRAHEVEVRDARTEQLEKAAARPAAAGRLEVRAPIPGMISKVLLKAGDRVEKHQTVCCLDAMKLENEITAPREGVLKELGAVAGKPVDKGQVLFVIE